MDIILTNMSLPSFTFHDCCCAHMTHSSLSHSILIFIIKYIIVTSSIFSYCLFFPHWKLLRHYSSVFVYLGPPNDFWKFPGVYPRSLEKHCSVTFLKFWELRIFYMISLSLFFFSFIMSGFGGRRHRNKILFSPHYIKILITLHKSIDTVKLPF